LQVRKRAAKIRHEGLDVVMAPARLVQRILQQHVRRRYVVDDTEIDVLAPEIGEPPTTTALLSSSLLI